MSRSRVDVCTFLYPADFCIFLHPVKLLNLFINSNRSLWISYHFLYTRSCHLQIDLVLLFFIPICMSLFLFFAYLSWLELQYNVYVAKAAILVFLLTLGKIQFFTSKYNVSCGFFRLGKFPSIPGLFEGFFLFFFKIMTWYWILSNSFSVSEMTIYFCPLVY